MPGTVTEAVRRGAAWVGSPATAGGQVVTRGAPGNAVIIELHANLEAPSIARRYVAAHAAALSHDLVDDAELLVSELVTNAVLHGLPTITLMLNLDPPGIGVGVHDASDQLPTRPGAVPGVDDVGGRGLLIVAALASAWGVEKAEDGPGKTVWFRLSTGERRRRT